MRITRNQQTQRQGAIAPFLCLIMIPLLGLLAFSVDYGFLLFVRTNLQRAADQAALAAVRDLEPNSYGTQDLQRVRQTVRDYVEFNLGSGFHVSDTDIQIGRFNPATVYGNLEFLPDGILDSVTVTVRNDSVSNHSISLYFARLFGQQESDVSATSTAILQKARYLGPESDVLPIGLPQHVWNQMAYGETVSVYGDGQIYDGSGNHIPGNWGTLDIGSRSNSSSALIDQIVNGLSQADLDALYHQNVIPTPTHIDGNMQIELNGDTGFSGGIKHGVIHEQGKTKLMPIFTHTVGHGGHLEFTIVGWGAYKIVDSHWKGSKNSNLIVRKSYKYDGDLRPHRDLSNTTSVIQGVYTSPVLIQ